MIRNDEATKDREFEIDLQEELEIEFDTDIEFSLDGLPVIEDGLLDSGLNATNTAVQGVNATLAGIQTRTLNEAIKNFSKSLNQAAIAKSTGMPVKTPSAQFKGFAAEEYFKQTLKIDALAKGVPDWQIGVYTKGTMPDGSNLSGIDMETDIAVWTREHPWSKPKRTANYQSKIHDNAADYAKDMANPQYENVDFVGGAGQGVNDKVTVEVGGKTVSSDSITPEEAYDLSDAMKAQKAPEYEHAAEKKTELNEVKLKQAVTMGAATGAISSTIKEIVFLIKENKDLPEDQFVKSIRNILCGSVEGGARGGAIAGSVQLLGKALGKEITEDAIGAVPAMAIANTSIDFAKDVYKVFITHTIDADDLLCNTVNNTFSSFAGFGGSWAGSQIAVSCLSLKTTAETGAAIGSALGPMGMAIGSAVGGMIIGYGAALIIETANKDAQKAFNQCIADIQEKMELTGVDSMCYFADAMSELSEFRVSFKNLLPCYNLISDLQEYNLRKKAIKNVHRQLDSAPVDLEESKRRALESLENQHAACLKKLEGCFTTQKQALLDQYNESTVTFISNSYVQFVNSYDIVNKEIQTGDATINQNNNRYEAALKRIKIRNEANKQLNLLLSELMEDPESAHLVKPFVNRLYKEMQNEQLSLERQYISFDEALALQGAAKYEYVG